MHYGTLMQIASLMHRKQIHVPIVAELLKEVVENDDVHRHMLVSNLASACRHFGLRIHSCLLFQKFGEASFDLATLPAFQGDVRESELPHFLRESFRLKSWHDVGVRRREFEGLQAVDRVRIVKVLQQNCQPHVHGALLTIFSGASITALRVSHQHGCCARDAICPFCNASCEETENHRFWQCSAWQFVRAEFKVTGLCLDNRWMLLPASFRRAGVCPTGFNDSLLCGATVADVQLMQASIYIAVVNFLLHAATDGFHVPALNNLRQSALFREWRKTKRASRLHAVFHMQD